MSECKSGRVHNNLRLVRFVAAEVTVDSDSVTAVAPDDSSGPVDSISGNPSSPTFVPGEAAFLNFLDESKLDIIGTAIDINPGQVIRVGFSANFTSAAEGVVVFAALFLTPTGQTQVQIPGSQIQLTSGLLGSRPEMGPISVPLGGAITVGFWASGGEDLDVIQASFTLSVVAI